VNDADGGRRELRARRTTNATRPFLGWFADKV
jgi:hypothetical protein